MAGKLSSKLSNPMNKTDNQSTQTASAQPGNVRIDSVKIEWLNDDDPDLSWLEQSDEEMGEGFEAHAKTRLESYGQSWNMLGCTAKAQVSYEIFNGSRRIEWLTSGGLWGIESDMDEATKREYEAEQLEDLASHLNHFGITINLEQLKEIAE